MLWLTLSKRSNRVVVMVISGPRHPAALQCRSGVNSNTVWWYVFVRWEQSSSACWASGALSLLAIIYVLWKQNLYKLLYKELCLIWETLWKLFQDETLTPEEPPSVWWGHFGVCLQGCFLRQKEAAGRSWCRASFYILWGCWENIREFLGYGKCSQSSAMGYHQHIPAHTKEDGLASVLEIQRVQASSPGYWQSGMGLDSSMQAKTPRILVIKHGEGYFDRRAQMNSSKIVFPPSVLNVNNLKNMLVLWLAWIFHKEGKRQKQQNFK